MHIDEKKILLDIQFQIVVVGNHLFFIENEDDILQCFLTNCLSEFPPIKKSIKLFVSAWININPPGDYNLKHNHPT